MKTRHGFVSNSSSSSFIINFDREIYSADDIPVKKLDIKGPTSQDIAKLLFDMLYKGWGVNLDRWLDSRYDSYRMSLSTQPWKYKIVLEDLIDCLKQKNELHDVEELEKIGDWGNNDNTYVFTVGNDSPSLLIDYGLNNNNIRFLSYECVGYHEKFMKHFDKIAYIRD